MLRHIQNVAWLALFSCLVIGFGFAVWQASSDRLSHSQTKQNKKTANEKPNDVLAVEEADDRIARYTLWLAVLTGGLVIASSIQFIFLYRADKTARIAATAVKDQASLTREAMIRTQRAFVFVKRICVGHQTNLVQSPTGPLVEVIVGWNIGIQWENTGDTPTRDLITHISLHEFQGEMPASYDFPDLNGTTTKSLLGPKAVCFSPVFSIPDSQARQTFQGESHLYMWGWAEYNDVFPDSDRHRTEFCYELLFIAPFPSKSSFTHRLHNRHNGAEDECSKLLQTASRIITKIR
jgi:hypothetical protein